VTDLIEDDYMMEAYSSESASPSDLLPCCLAESKGVRLKTQQRRRDE